MSRSGRWVAVAIVVMALGIAGVVLWRSRTADPVDVPSNDAQAAATFAGLAACAECHRTETDRWRASMHARAMELPTAESVKAPFAGETFRLGGVTTTFSRSKGEYVAKTDGPDGVLRDYPVKYTFGVTPLQQYLLEIPGGRLQALGVSWDSRPSPAGQNWFHLNPSATRADDVQHWTSRSQNWNLMCADCHSTNLRKRYNPDADTYRTTWSDLNVACEACHGAGSRHVQWARLRGSNAPAKPDEDVGLVRLGGRDAAGWQFDPMTGIAHRAAARSSHVEVEMCARCHSRRAQLTDVYRAGRPLADTHLPSLLEDDLYFADGQIKDEVYEYGSFLQSKMYANGVTCSDCHDPHTPEITTNPDEVCQKCHLSTVFAKPTHHRHAEGSPGSRCVACHMPSRTYMKVDDRRDHSFRVPRPDLTVSIGTPNACTPCHATQPAAWAAAKVAEWRGPSKTLKPHYGEALAAGRSMAADAEPRLLAVVGNAQAPAIARASAISLLQRWVDARSMPVIIDALRDPDSMVRLAAVNVLANLPVTERSSVLAPLLGDDIRSVRIAVARALAAVPEQSLSVVDRALRTRGITEWERAQEFNADTAGAHLNLGAYYAELGDTSRAKTHYETARRLEPYFAPAAVNLADLYRELGNDSAGEQVLRDAIKRTPSVAALHHSLGLLLARRKNLPAALAELKRAADLEPDNIDWNYAYGVALYSAGRVTDAIAHLDRVWRKHPGDRTTLTALISYVRERGDKARAESLAMSLVQISPEDPRARALLEEIQRGR